MALPRLRPAPPETRGTASRRRRLALSALVAPLLLAPLLAAGGPAGAASGKPVPAAPSAPSAGSDLAAGAQHVVAADVAATQTSRVLSPAVSPAVSRASATIESRITTFVRNHGAEHSFGTYTDPASGKVVIETDAPAGVVSSLVGTYGRVVDVRRATVSDNFSRRNDTPPFWGGAAITGTLSFRHCTSGYAVKNSAGTRRFMVTVGHCLRNGEVVRTALGGRVVGTAFGNAQPSADMILIGGASYAPFIYVGGVNSNTGRHVASAADPVVGFNNYCHSGAATGEQCGHTVTSVNATVCTSSGCKSPVIAFTGGVLPQAGDSGAPLYANSVSAPDVHIRGHIMAGGGGTVYAEKYSRVAARYGVSILT